MVIIASIVYYMVVGFMTLSVATFYRIMRDSALYREWFTFAGAVVMFTITTTINLCVFFEVYELIIGPIEHALFG